MYSEIASRLRVNSTVQQHVRDHVRDFVAIRPRRRRGTVFVLGGGKERYDELWRQPLYVDPRDGILKRTDQLPEAKAHKQARQPKAAPPGRISLGGDRELRRLDGIWYEIRLAPLPEPSYRVVTELRQLPLKSYHRTSPVVAINVTVRRLACPGV